MHSTRLLLLRHAETADPNRFHGAESDVPLGERGLRQAEAVARVLAAERPDLLYSSAMTRARQTAVAIGEACGLVPVILPDLHERRMGSLSGLARVDGLAEYEKAKTRWVSGDLDYTHEGGESYAQIRDRVVPLIRSVVDTALGKTVVVVAHGVVIRVILTTLLEGNGHADFERYPIDNVAINDLRREGDRWEALALNRRIDSEGDRFAW